MHLLGGNREQPGGDRPGRLSEAEEVAERDLLPLSGAPTPRLRPLRGRLLHRDVDYSASASVFGAPSAPAGWKESDNVNTRSPASAEALGAFLG